MRLHPLVLLAVVAALSLRTTAQPQPVPQEPANTTQDSEQTIQLGMPVHAPDPAVPKNLRDHRAVAVLGATIKVDGSFADLSALGGDREFEDSALGAVSQWRYTPATLNGSPVEARVFVVIYSNKGSIRTVVEPDLPFPTKPRKSIEEQRAHGEIAALADHVQSPRAIYNPQPKYSEAAQAAQYEGTVTLGLIVDRGGNVADVWVIRKARLGLEQMAIHEIRRWKFAPATKDGEPVAVFTNIEVKFLLE